MRPYSFLCGRSSKRLKSSRRDDSAVDSPDDVLRRQKATPEDAEVRRGVTGETLRAHNGMVLAFSEPEGIRDYVRAPPPDAVGGRLASRCRAFTEYNPQPLIGILISPEPGLTGHRCPALTSIGGG